MNKINKIRVQKLNIDPCPFTIGIREYINAAPTKYLIILDLIF